MVVLVVLSDSKGLGLGLGRLWDGLPCWSRRTEFGPIDATDMGVMVLEIRKVAAGSVPVRYSRSPQALGASHADRLAASVKVIIRGLHLPPGVLPWSLELES